MQASPSRDTPLPVLLERTLLNMNIIPLRVALAQVNVTVGDLEANTEKIRSAMQHAHAAGAHIVCLPGLAMTANPPEHLFPHSPRVPTNLRTLRKMISSSR